MHLICSSWHWRRCCDPQQHVGKLYPSIWWTTRGTWILNARIFKHSFRISRPFFLCFLRIVFSFFFFVFGSIRFAFLFRPQNSFVCKLNGNKSELCIFIGCKTKTKKNEKTKTQRKLSIWAQWSEFWIHSNDLVFLAVSLKKAATEKRFTRGQPSQQQVASASLNL